MRFEYVTTVLFGFALLTTSAAAFSETPPAQPVSEGFQPYGTISPLPSDSNSNPHQANEQTANSAGAVIPPAEPEPQPILPPLASEPERKPIFLRSKYKTQLGLGFTIIPFQWVWNGNNYFSYYQAGFTGDLNFRIANNSSASSDRKVAESVDIRISLGGIGSEAVDGLGSNISELLISGEARIYFFKNRVKPHEFHVAPFLAAGFAYSFSSFGYAADNSFHLGYDYASYIGGLFGIGLEFRLGRSYSLVIDARGILQGALRTGRGPTGETYFDTFRGIFRMGIGAAYYF